MTVYRYQREDLKSHLVNLAKEKKMRVFLGVDKKGYLTDLAYNDGTLTKLTSNSNLKNVIASAGGGFEAVVEVSKINTTESGGLIVFDEMSDYLSRQIKDTLQEEGFNKHSVESPIVSSNRVIKQLGEYIGMHNATRFEGFLTNFANEPVMFIYAKTKYDLDVVIGMYSMLIQTTVGSVKVYDYSRDIDMRDLSILLNTLFNKIETETVERILSL